MKYILKRIEIVGPFKRVDETKGVQEVKVIAGIVDDPYGFEKGENIVVEIPTTITINEADKIILDAGNDFINKAYV